MLMYLKAVKTFPPQQNLQNTCASLSYESLFQRKEEITQPKIGDVCFIFLQFSNACVQCLFLYILMSILTLLGLLSPSGDLGISLV